MCSGAPGRLWSMGWVNHHPIPTNSTTARVPRTARARSPGPGPLPRVEDRGGDGAHQDGRTPGDLEERAYVLGRLTDGEIVLESISPKVYDHWPPIRARATTPFAPPPPRRGQRTTTVRPTSTIENSVNPASIGSCQSVIGALPSRVTVAEYTSKPKAKGKPSRVERTQARAARAPLRPCASPLSDLAGHARRRYSFLNTIPTQLSCGRRFSRLKPAAHTALAVSLARVATEPLAIRTPACRIAVASSGARSISTLGKIFAATTSYGGSASSMLP